MRFFPQRRSNIVAGKSLDTFQGQIHPDAANYLNVNFGQLLFNKNLEYRWSQDNVYLETKRGSTLVGDIEDSNFLGSNFYYYNSVDFYYVWVTNTGYLKTMDESLTITTIKTGLTTSEKSNFVMFGQGTLSTLYGCNRTDGIFKISGSTPTYASVNSTGIVDISFSFIGGRMLGVVDHKLVFSEQQVSAVNLTNLENFQAASYFIISPDSGTGFVRIIDDGQVAFLFKDSGIWYLPNAAEATTDWRFPKASNMPGTLSPQTVCLVKYGGYDGILYLASDKTLRLLTYQFENNAGTTPSLVDRKSHIVSELFQPLLDRITTSAISNCTAGYYNGQYVLNYPSEGSVNINSTIVVDTEKLFKKTGVQTIPQPFWFRSENMDYLNMLVRSDKAEFIGFNKNGYITKLFIDDFYEDQVPSRIDSSESLSIDWQWFTGWIRYYRNEAELVEVILNWKTDNLNPINFYVNSFTTGRNVIPYFEDSTPVTVTPDSAGRAYYDISFWDIDSYSNRGQSSQNTGKGAFGEYFLFGAANREPHSAAAFYGIQPYFKQVRRSGLTSVS